MSRGCVCRGCFGSVGAPTTPISVSICSMSILMLPLLVCSLPECVQARKHVVVYLGLRECRFMGQMGGGPGHAGTAIEGLGGLRLASLQHTKRRLGDRRLYLKFVWAGCGFAPEGGGESARHVDGCSGERLRLSATHGLEKRAGRRCRSSFRSCCSGSGPCWIVSPDGAENKLFRTAHEARVRVQGATTDDCMTDDQISNCALLQ